MNKYPEHNSFAQLSVFNRGGVQKIIPYYSSSSGNDIFGSILSLGTGAPFFCAWSSPCPVRFRQVGFFSVIFMCNSIVDK